MTTLKTYTISAGRTEVFNFEVMAPDANTALALAKVDWSTHDVAHWLPCGPTDKPHFQVEDERDVHASDIKSYDVSYTVTDRLYARIAATTMDEALRIGRALRDENGTYEGSFEVVDSEVSDMDAEEVVS
jgi:hypothetical protein